MDALKQKTLNSLFWRFLERGGSQMVSLLVQVVLARILAPEQFGMIAIVLVFINIATVFVQNGFNTALIQNRTISNEDYSTVFWSSLGIASVLYALVFAGAPIASEFYNMLGLDIVLRVLSVTLFFGAYNSIQIAYVMRELEYKKLFKGTIAAVLISGALAILLALCGAGIWALVAQQLSCSFVSCAVLSTMVPWKPKLVFSLQRAKILFSFGWKLLLSSLIDTGYSSLYDLVIGKAFSASDLAYYSQGKKYPDAITKLIDGSIQSVTLSTMSKLQDDYRGARNLMRRAIQTSTFVLTPLLACACILAQQIIVLILGEKWLLAVPFFQMACLSAMFRPVHTTNLQTMNALGRSDLFLKLEIIKKTLGCILFIAALILTNNVYAVAMTSVISSIICTFVNAAPNRKLLGYSYKAQFKDIAPAFGLSLLVSLVSFGILQITSFGPLLDLLAIGGFTLLLYGFLGYVFKLESFEYTLKVITDARSKFSQ